MAGTPKYDLVLRGGTLLDPGQRVNDRRDVAFKDGKVALAAARIDPGDARHVVDVVGKLVTPGLIDLHGHFYNGVNADDACLPAGVTTAIDAGSAGWANYQAMRDYVFPSRKTRLLAFLHIGAAGLLPARIVGGELRDIDYADADKTADAIKENPGLLIGVKIRMKTNAISFWDARVGLMRAREAADKATVKLMVHIADTPIPLPEILEVLKPGDVVTHVFHGRPEGILRDDGTVRPEVKAAAQRGVIMDIAHAGPHNNGFDIEVARAALRQGFIPTTISTDMHARAYSQNDVISELHAMGLTVEEAIAASTAQPAKVLGMESQIGSLAPGMAGDAAVFDLREGRHLWHDRPGRTVEGKVRLETVVTVKDGAVVWRAGRGD